MEPNGGNGEKTEPSNLSADTNKTQSLTQVKLGLSIVLRRVSPGDQYRSNQLQQERNDVEPNEQEGDKAGFSKRSARPAGCLFI